MKKPESAHSKLTKPLKERKSRLSKGGRTSAADELKAAQKSASRQKIKGALSLGGKNDLGRFLVIWGAMAISFVLLIWRAFYVQVVNAEYYIAKGRSFSSTVEPVPVSRGLIVDSFGTPLAATGPLTTLIFNPYEYALAYYDAKRKVLEADNDTQRQARETDLQKLSLTKLAAVTNYPLDKLEAAVKIDPSVDVQDVDAIRAALPKGAGSRHLVLLNKVTPEVARPATQLMGKPMLVSETISQRFYLQAEPNAQILGYMARSSKDGEYKGRAGIEGQYDALLAGKSGEVLVLRTGDKSQLRQIKELKPAVAAKDVQLTIDSRLQYVLYKELEQVGRAQSARWASGMVVDVTTGDVLAMGSWPSFNANKLAERTGSNERNRAVLDVFEPGSVMKPFTVAAALESGRYNTNTLIDTGNGTLNVGRPISDSGRYGAITLAKLIQKSSNVASGKIALSLPTSAIADIQRRFGFGKKTALNFPSEAAGRVDTPKEKEYARRVTLAYGYGQSVTLAQIAQAYATLGNGGLMQPLRLVKTNPTPQAMQVIDKKHAQDIVEMMELVTVQGGTATKAAIDGYRVAGKTGTTHRAKNTGGYHSDQYRAIFAGVVPASNPRFSVVILVEDPRVLRHGGTVAAPVFAKVALEALRLYNIPFDKPLENNPTPKRKPVAN